MQDKMDGSGHADGRVYKNYYSNFYFVAGLEAKGLWVNLEKAISNMM